MPIHDRLRALLAPHVNASAPAHTHDHVCTDVCAEPCKHAGATYRYAPVAIPKDHVLLEWYTLPDGGRVVIDIPMDALGAHFDEHPSDAPITHASATAALAKKHGATGKDTGIQTYVDKWRDEGLLP